MEGYIFINSEGNRLTKGKWWGFENRFQGWVFTPEERDEIMQEIHLWEKKPAYIQRARVSDDYTEVTTLGDRIPVVV